jgi:oxygen-independent coproporphyrinogen-3 oxidase
MSGTIDTAYVHIPFCKSKCSYCDFNSYAGQDNHIEAYFSALTREIHTVRAYYENHAEQKPGLLRNVYIGGGTPSYAPSEYIVKVMEELRAGFEFSKEAQITIECNPGTVNLQKMNDYRKAGINRISIGLQSASDNLLREIGRIHTRKDFEKCMDLADQAGLKNRNVDLMFGLPHQTMEDVRTSIQLVLDRKVTHISFYSLILEEGTPFYEKYKHSSELLPSEDMERAMYWSGVETFQKNGFMHYEISNLAKPGFSCDQNISYWKTKEYLGFGAGAHSYQQRTRIENEHGIAAYVKKTADSRNLTNAPAAIERCTLTQSDRELEYFMLGFRLMEGIDTDEFERLFSTSVSPYIPRLNELIQKGYIKKDGKRYQLTKNGIDFANQVFIEFV